MAQFTKTEQLLKYFEHTGATHFKIYLGVKDNLSGVPPVFQFKDATHRKAKQKLEEILQLMEEGGDEPITYTLHCFESEDGEGDKTSNKKSVVSFRFGEKENQYKKMAGVDTEKSIDTIKSLYEKMLEEKKTELEDQKKIIVDLNERITAIEESEGEEIGTPEPTATEQIIGALAPMAIQYIPMLVDKLLNKNSVPQAPTQQQNKAAVNGVPEIDRIIVELQKHVPDLEVKLQKLLDMAEQNPTQFKTLLNFL